MTAADCPGYYKLMSIFISQTYSVDAALFIISTNNDSDFQIIDQIIGAKSMGCKKFIIVINKMDLVNYDQKVFEEWSNHVMKLMKNIKADQNIVKIIPSAGFHN